MTQTSTASNGELNKVLELYGLKPYKVEPLGSIFKVYCQDETYALKKSSAPREKLLLLSKMFKKVTKEGFSHLLGWVDNTQAVNVTTVNGQGWYLTRWKEPSSEVASLRGLDTVKALGEFHKLSEQLVNSYKMLFKKIDEEFLSKLEEKKEKLNKLQEFQLKKEFLSPFDKSFNEYKEKIEKAIDFTRKGFSRLSEANGGELPRYSLCHTRLHPSNILNDENDFFFIDWDNAEVDTPVRDLATFIRRATLQGGTVEELYTIVEAYEQSNPLKPMEKKLLGLYLAYPERVMKNINSYYKGKYNSLDEYSVVSNLEADIGHFELLQKLVTSLWNKQESQKAKETSDEVGPEKPKKAFKGEKRVKKKKKTLST